MFCKTVVTGLEKLQNSPELYCHFSFAENVSIKSYYYGVLLLSDLVGPPLISSFDSMALFGMANVGSRYLKANSLMSLQPLARS